MLCLKVRKPAGLKQISAQTRSFGVLENIRKPYGAELDEDTAQTWIRMAKDELRQNFRNQEYRGKFLKGEMWDHLNNMEYPTEDAEYRALRKKIPTLLERGPMFYFRCNFFRADLNPFEIETKDFEEGRISDETWGLIKEKGLFDPGALKQFYNKFYDSKDSEQSFVCWEPYFQWRDELPVKNFMEILSFVTNHDKNPMPEYAKVHHLTEKTPKPLWADGYSKAEVSDLQRDHALYNPFAASYEDVYGKYTDYGEHYEPMLNQLDEIAEMDEKFFDVQRHFAGQKMGVPKLLSYQFWPMWKEAQAKKAQGVAGFDAKYRSLGQENWLVPKVTKEALQYMDYYEKLLAEVDPATPWGDISGLLSTRLQELNLTQIPFFRPSQGFLGMSVEAKNLPKLKKWLTSDNGGKFTAETEHIYNFFANRAEEMKAGTFKVNDEEVEMVLAAKDFLGRWEKAWDAFTLRSKVSGSDSITEEYWENHYNDSINNEVFQQDIDKVKSDLEAYLEDMTDTSQEKAVRTFMTLDQRLYG